ncbi:MAG: hypothetical protein PWP23_2592 [Candidatus Sumerlaeota bacterium]|nr:hypothetical protein [Candidatus Sumerlaeota bacterium]
MKKDTQTRRKKNEKEWVKMCSRPLFNLYQSTMEANLWQIRLNGSGGYLRRRFNAPTLRAALDEAVRVAGLDALESKEQVILLADAFSMTLANTNRREPSRRAWLRDTERFMRWLKKRYPLCIHWGMMTRQVFREYLGTFKGLSDNHKRLSMQPLLQTAGFMHREYGFPNIGERMGIGSKLRKTPPTVYLEDAVAFCDYLREHRPHLEVGAALQGLAGLQVQEALRLTWKNVDLERGFIEVTGEVKNVYRNRVIPVTNRVLEALRRAEERRREREGKVQSLTGHVLVGVKGEPYTEYQSYCRQLKTAMLRWNPQIDWAPKDLRNCLPTFAKMEGIHGTIWEQYIGHSPGTVTDRHYVPRLTARTSGEENALLRAMELFRKFVTLPLETQAPAGEICNFLQLSGSDGASESEEGSVSAVE